MFCSDTQKSEERFLRIKEVIQRTALSRSYIYKLSEDGRFPKAIKLVPGGSAVAWRETEIDSWIESRIALSIEGTK